MYCKNVIFGSFSQPDFRWRASHAGKSLVESSKPR
jgi:hypothetical protein